MDNYDQQHQHVSSQTNIGRDLITKGYSRDHRPDLNQVTLQLSVGQQADIPLLMQNFERQ